MATSLMDTAADWCHLLYLFAFLTIARLLQWFILGFYTLFPFPGLLDRLYFASKRLQMWFSFKLGQGADGATPRSKAAGDRLKAESLVEGSPYALETHMVQTEDGFVLVLHRLVPRLASAAGEGNNQGDNNGGGKRSSSFTKGFGRSNSDNGATTGATSSGGGARRPPVLLMHALMQDSEAFLCGGGEHSLALFLADQGFDVWLGNNRGNRYSHKHLRLKPSEDEYWNFSIDELARYDVPALMDYVLQATGHAQLRYVGFSQGSAQAFAAFTMDHGKLAQKVKLFVALSAPPRAKGLNASYLSALVESNPRFIYLLFGRHAMLPSTLMWMKILSPQLFVAGVDRAIRFLFDWSAATISRPRKVELYQHIFSYASVKTVVQWFQLIKLRRLAMYSDDTSAHRVPVEYDLKRLRVPTAVFVGLKDTVIDPEALKRDLPPTSVVKWHEEPEYEHLDMIWADSAPKHVFGEVAALLKAYSGEK